jgi:von Willebrand factor type D domain
MHITDRALYTIDELSFYSYLQQYLNTHRIMKKSIFNTLLATIFLLPSVATPALAQNRFPPLNNGQWTFYPSENRKVPTASQKNASPPKSVNTRIPAKPNKVERDTSNSNQDVIVATGDVLILSPYRFQSIPLTGLRNDLKDEVINKLRQKLGAEKIHHRYNLSSESNNIQIKDFINLERYGVIVITTHSSEASINTGIIADESNKKSIEKALGIKLNSPEDWNIAGLGINNKNRIYITSDFIRKYVKLNSNNNPLIYISGCKALGNDLLAQAFLNKGAKAVIGYDIFINWTKENHSVSIFNELLARQTTGNLSALQKTVSYPFENLPESVKIKGRVRLLGANNLVIIPPESPKPIDKPISGTTTKVADRKGKQVKGTSYGDPHLITFDGHRYSFQTVGEFILAKSSDRVFEVQTRQSPVNRSLSLNSAVAIRVGNDRVAFYSKDFPDSDTSTPLRVNGKPTVVKDKSLTLPGGGSIQKQSDSNYVVQWATGEKVAVTIYSRGQFQYMDVFPFVFESQANQMVGLLGNVNGKENDDLRFRSGDILPSKSTYGDLSKLLNGISPIRLPLGQLEKMYFDKLNKDFGNSWRVTAEESLFDYPSGKSSKTFTDKAFPDAYLTLDMLSPAQLQAARSQCVNAGVQAGLLEGCVFDVGFTGYSEFAARTAQFSNILDIVESVIPGFKNPIPEVIRKLPKIPGLPF